jgi:NAD+ diphosphatase
MPHVFASNPIDRAQVQRRDPAWLEAQRADPRGRYLPMRQLAAGIRRGESPQLAWLDAAAADRSPGIGATCVLLGVHDGAPHFAFAIDDPGDDTGDGIEFADARAIGSLLPVAEAGILAQARSMLDWHARHRFCPHCGGETFAVEAGARRACASCGARHYPQVNPSIIVLVERDGHCLLGRRANTTGTRHSCLAGYVEPGESLEEAVAREVFEESGVLVGDVRYHSSQPWPFPATLMVGCVAAASSSEIVVDLEELAEARWFSRDEARSALAGANPELSVPDPVAIAHHLIRDWVEGRL